MNTKLINQLICLAVCQSDHLLSLLPFSQVDLLSGVCRVESVLCAPDSLFMVAFLLFDKAGSGMTSFSKSLCL